MNKKTVALSLGLAMVAMGASPVFAQTTQTSTPEVEITEQNILEIVTTSPFGSAANAYDLTPTSSTVSTKVAASGNAANGSGNNAESVLRAYSTNVQGFQLTIEGSATTPGVLKGATNNIPNNGGLAIVTGAGDEAQVNDDFEGLAFRIRQTGSAEISSQATEDGADDTGTEGYTFTAGSVDIVTKYGADAAANALWYNVDDGSAPATATAIARVVQFVDPAVEGDTDSRLEAVVDWLIAAKAGLYAPEVKAETVTFTLVPL